MRTNQTAWAGGTAKERQDGEVGWRRPQLSAPARHTGTGEKGRVGEAPSGQKEEEGKPAGQEGKKSERPASAVLSNSVSPVSLRLGSLGS